MLPMPRSVFPVSKVDKLRMPRRCQPVNHAVPNVSLSLPPFKPCDRCCHEFLITATATPLSPPFGDSGRQEREVVTFVEGQPHHTPRGPGTLPFLFGEGHRAHPHTTGGASLLCLSLHRILGGQSFSPPLSGRVPYPCVCCFLMPTATAGCSCPWREYAADVVECVSCFHG